MVLGGCRCFGGDFECVLLIECCNEFPCCFLPICFIGRFGAGFEGCGAFTKLCVPRS